MKKEDILINQIGGMNYGWWDKIVENQKRIRIEKFSCQEIEEGKIFYTYNESKGQYAYILLFSKGFIKSIRI